MTDMQPETPRVPNGPEQAPQNTPQNGEHIPVLPTPESVPLQGGERYEQTAEAGAAAADAASGIPLPPPLPPLAQPPVAIPTTLAPTDDNPAIAGDEDVIEKEWVDKAKKILLETRDDPYGRTARVNELQKDYLKKRYNKDLGSSE